MKPVWAQTTLGEIAEIVSGATPSTSVKEYWDGDIRWVTPKDLSDLDGSEISHTARSISSAGLRSCAASVLPANSVLLSSRAPIGLVAINRVPMATNQGFKSLVPDPRRVDSRFLYWWLKKHRPLLESLGNGATFKEISKKSTAAVPISLPPIEEQRRIAAILDAADALRSKRRQAIEKLDSLTKSIFIDMFGDPVSNPKGLPSQSLAGVVEGKGGVKAGPFGSSLLKSDYTASGYRVYGQEQVIAGRFDVGNYFISQRKYEQLSACAVAPGDILVSLVGSFGKVLVVPPDTPAGIINPRLLRIRPDRHRIRPIYLASLLETSAVQRFLHGAAHGGTMGVLNAALVKAVPVTIPPMGMQMEFEQRRGALEELSLLGCSSATVLDEAFASLQHRAFRGEL